MQVSRAAPLLANSLADPNEPVLFEVGAMVRGFTFDGVGRLVRTVSPWPTPEMPSGEVRVERYFYDGVRRISEVTTDPLQSVAMALAGNAGSQAQGEAQNAIELEEELETEGVTVGVQQAQANPNTPYGGEHLTREYIWGPGDNGLDELLVQFDANRNASWPVQDAGGDLIALLDTNGPPPSGGTGSTARLVGEWTYDPYGNVVTRVEHHSFAEPRFGHKGLVVERLDGGIIDPATGYEVPRLEEAATTLVFARNRHLHTGFGRWLQEDPNATGEPVVSRAFHAAALMVSVAPGELETLYHDGANLFAYAGADPVCNTDPLGLLFDEDPEEVVLEAVGELDGFMPVSAMTPLNKLLEGYHTLKYALDFYKNAAFDEEDMIDWATDMSADDDPYSGGGCGEVTTTVEDAGPVMAVGAGPRMTPGPRFNPIRMQGVGAERRARVMLGAKPMRRMIEGRYYDGVGKGKPGSVLGKGHLLEVKDSVTGVNGRVSKQLNKDAALMRNRPGTRIHWRFELRKGQQLTPRLQEEMTNRGIQWSVVHK